MNAALSTLTLLATLQSDPLDRASVPSAVAPGLESFGVSWTLAHSGELVAISSPRYPWHQEEEGIVAFCSLRSGSLLAVSGPGDAREPIEEADFGWRVCEGSDYDGDGIPEIIASAPGRGGETRGSLHVLSAISGESLQRLKAPKGCSLLGRELCAAGDSDLDGIDDLFVLAKGQSEGGGASSDVVLLVSGRTGERLHEVVDLPVRPSGVTRAWNLESIGDVNQDRMRDVAIAEYVPAPGRVFVCSGFDGRVLGHVEGQTGEQFFGRSLANVGDLDGDGVAELAIGVPYEVRDGRSLGGKVVVVSGADYGRLFRTRPSGPGSDEGLGTAVAACPDVDGDHVPDIVAGTPGAGFGGGAVILSGRDGSLIRRLTNRVGTVSAGYSIAACLDLTGDGEPAVLLGTFNAAAGPAPSQGVIALSGRTGDGIHTFLRCERTEEIRARRDRK